MASEILLAMKNGQQEVQIKQEISQKYEVITGQINRIR
jgi:hypothetical protein